VNVLCVVDNDDLVNTPYYRVYVAAVTQLHDVVYVACHLKYAIIWTFNATTHQELIDIFIDGLRMPCDIVACEQTSQLYVADRASRFGDPCIWRVSTDGTDIQDWLPKSPFDTFIPESL